MKFAEISADASCLPNLFVDERPLSFFAKAGGLVDLCASVLGLASCCASPRGFFACTSQLALIIAVAALAISVVTAIFVTAPFEF